MRTIDHISFDVRGDVGIIWEDKSFSRYPASTFQRAIDEDQIETLFLCLGVELGPGREAVLNFTNANFEPSVTAVL